MNFDYFTENGHLTAYAFELLENPDTDELARLEISEHLSFCDDCLLRYTDFMTQDKLMQTPDNMTREISARIVKTAVNEMFRRYVCVCTAACIAMIFWLGGIFTPDLSDYDKSTSNTVSISDKIEDRYMGISQSIGKFFADRSNKHFDRYYNN